VRGLTETGFGEFFGGTEGVESIRSRTWTRSPGNDASGKWAAIMYSLIRTCEARHHLLPGACRHRGPGSGAAKAAMKSMRSDVRPWADLHSRINSSPSAHRC
jgi:hypothetical protein